MGFIRFFLTLWAILAFSLLETSLAQRSSMELNKGNNFNKDSKTSFLKFQSNKKYLNINDIKIEINYPFSKKDIIPKLLKNLRISKKSLSKLLSSDISFETKVSLYTEDDFFKLTGAPEWTNALFLNNEISLPVNSDVLESSLKHEFTHAYINALSKSKCPAWLDEGIAQWIEGSNHQILTSIYKDWLKRNSVIPFKLLENGFLNLSSEIVGAAYAQSLFGFELLLEKYGKRKIDKYFRLLKKGQKHKKAFRRTFRISEVELEALIEDRFS